jgi:tetrahydromethanopterin S-methyltransferase subunit B
VARIQPEVQLAIEESRRMVEDAASDCAKAKELEEQREELQNQADEMKKELEDEKEDLIDQQQELQEENFEIHFSPQLPI